MNVGKETVSGWEVFPRKTILKTPVADISSGPVRCLRSNQVTDFIHFDFPEWVNVVALTKQLELVMIRQFRYGSGRIELEIPGGVMHAGESPVEVGCRELLEETGYKGEKATVIGHVCPNPAL